MGRFVRRVVALGHGQGEARLKTRTTKIVLLLPPEEMISLVSMSSIACFRIFDSFSKCQPRLAHDGCLVASSTHRTSHKIAYLLELRGWQAQHRKTILS